MKKLFLILILGILVGSAFGQNARYDNIVVGPKGVVPFATIAVCTQPANSSTQPCTPLAALCSSLTDVTCTQPNPVTADFLGNFHFYYKPSQGPFTLQFFGPQVSGLFVMSDQLTQILSGTFTNAILIEPTINQGISNNGTGFKHIRVAGCTTGGAGTACSVTATWTSAFADASYTVSCSPVGLSGTSGGFVVYQGVFSQSASQVVPSIVNGGSGGTATATNFDCIAVHD
jgi:hypothetical protein